MKRVLLTAHKFFPEHRAGTEVLTLKIAQELQKRGYEVKVVAACPPDLDARRKVEHESAGDAQDYVYEGVPVHIIGESLRLRDYEFSNEYYHPLIKRHFAGILADFQPDILQIVHAQNLSASIIEAACERNIPVVFYSTDFWFVCPIVQLKRPDGQVCRGPGPFALKCLDCYTPRLLPPAEEVVQAVCSKYPPVAGTIESSPALVKAGLGGALNLAYTAMKGPGAVAATMGRPGILRKLANKLSAIMVPTRLMRDIFVENGINQDLITHVPFGIDTSKLEMHTRKVPADKLRIGFIGTFFEHKGVDLLIKAFLSLPAQPSSELKLYGDPSQFPEYFARLKKLVDEGGSRGKFVHFLGTFPNDTLGEVLEKIDVLVVPSRWYENTPLVMQSALATKTPLVCTDLGGMAELVEDGENGLLFKLNDHRSLAEKLAILLKKPGELERFMSNIKSERTVPDMVNDIESVYSKVIDR